MKITPAIAVLALVGIIALTACRDTTPTPQPTVPPTPPPTATSTAVLEAPTPPVPTPTPAPTLTPAPTSTPIPTPSPTPPPTPSPTPAPLYLEGWRTVSGSAALDRSKPALASAIIALPWVSDGISGVEREVVRQLVTTAMLYEPVFLAVADKSWVVDGLDRTERGILRDLTRFRNESAASRIAGLAFLETVESADSTTVDILSDLDISVPQLLPAVVDKPWTADGLSESESEVVNALWGIAADDNPVALRILAMPFLETVGPDDVLTMNALWTLMSDGVEVVFAVIDNPWVGDGLQGLEAEAIDWIGNFSDAEVALSVVALGWIEDGIEELEVKAIQELSYIDYDDPALASAVVASAWMQDGIEDLEIEAIEWVGNFSDVEVAASVVDLAWVQDGVEELEVRTIEELSYIDFDDAALASSVAALAWVQDGIQDLEFEAIEWIGNFSSPIVAAEVVALDWVQDRFEDVEVKAIQELSYVDFYDEDVASSLVGLSWIQNAVSSREVRAIEDIRLITRTDADEALRIVTMPFLESLEPPDVSAVKSLSLLSFFRQADFQRILSHPTLSNGITDDWAKVVATLYGVSDTNPELIDTLLDPDQVTLEERTIDLPLAGETHLAIIRTAPGAERSMDLLEHSTRSIESYMAVPLPTNYVALLYENAVSGDSAGTNFGTHVTALPKYDVDDDSNAAEFAGSLIAHEVAHYYWSGNRGWVDEGIADLMGSLSENARVGLPIEVTNNPCGYVRTIAELETLEPEVGDSAYSCNYALGERLFVDLYRNFDEDDFRTGLWQLYLLSQVEDENETDEDVLTGIDHVRTAFKDAEDVEDSLVDVVTARWYDGTEPYSTSEESTGLPNPLLSTINGRIHTAYLSATQKGTPLTTISAAAVDDYLWLLLRWDYTVGSNTEVPLELVHYYEDGFEFKRRSVSFPADARHNGTVWSWWLQVGQSPTKPWATGNYRFQVYNEGRKLVELEYEVTP